MVQATPCIKAIIATLDNLPMLKQQIAILRNEPISEIIVVNNGSEDGTGQWLESQENLTFINRENNGAGPGRNAGLDTAGEYDYVLMLDGGIRPLRGGVAGMLVYMEKHPEVDVFAPEWATCYTTDLEKAFRRWVGFGKTFVQRGLSGTAYALCRRSAWERSRFSEEGPFGQPGWGVDDNEMQCRWNLAGILHHDYTDVLLYRLQSGSFNRLFRETGIWPTQYGSVYEQRLVLLSQTYPQFVDPIWHKTALEVSCVLVGQDDYPDFAHRIKALHEELEDTPHEIIFVDNASSDRTKWWLDTFALRWPHGDTAIDAQTGAILHRHKHDLESIWTGNVIRVDLSERVDADAAFAIGAKKSMGMAVRRINGTS